jgi:DNA polymerase V
VTKIDATLLLNFVQAGFPSPGEELDSSPLDTNKLLIRNPAATFFMRVTGSSMQDAGIFDGDIVVVDKSIEPRSNDVVVAILNEAYTLKRFRLISGSPHLLPDSKTHSEIEIHQEDELRIWGVVTFVVRSLRKNL